jgi:outer membrane protein assembly factor BamB
MKKLVAAVVTLLLAAPLAPAQGLARTYTTPCVPPREHLELLNLKMAWRLFVPMDGRRDGFFSVQILDDQILVQTRSGGVVMLDAATGATLWRARHGIPYAVTQRLGYNKQSVFIVNGSRLYALNRATGQLLWEFPLPDAPSAAPVADDTNIYLCLGTGRIYVYELPILGPGAVAAAPAARPTVAEEPPRGDFESRYRAGGTSLSSNILGYYLRPPPTPPKGPQPRLLWEYTLGNGRLEQAPLLTTEFLTVADSNGVFFTTSKYVNRELWRFRAEAAVSAPLGQYGESAYIASQDFNVYALDIINGRILWRVLGGAPILQRPYVTDEDVYVVPASDVLYRIDRATGQIDWQAPRVDHFLAMNKKFVYGLDPSGNLVVLDRVRGTNLSTYCGTRDFVFPIGNELTDRIYLAANDGLLLCLHDRDYPTPLRNRNIEEKKAEEGKEKTEEKGVERPKKEIDKGEEKMPERPKKEIDKGDEKIPDQPKKDNNKGADKPPAKPLKEKDKGNGKDKDSKDSKDS